MTPFSASDSSGTTMVLYANAPVSASFDALIASAAWRRGGGSGGGGVGGWWRWRWRWRWLLLLLMVLLLLLVISITLPPLPLGSSAWTRDAGGERVVRASRGVAVWRRWREVEAHHAVQREERERHDHVVA